MTTPTPELVTAEQAAVLSDALMRSAQDLERPPSIQSQANIRCINAMHEAARTVIALHEALAAEKARADAAEAARDRAVEDAIYNAQYVDLVSKYRARADAAEVELARLKSSHQGLAKNSASNIEYWRSLAIKLEARVAALEARTPVAWMGREGYFTTDPRQASAHAHHGTPLTPLYARAALETGAGDD